MNKKKLLCIDQGEVIGGAERFIAELLDQVADDYEVELICTSNDAYKTLYRHQGIRFHERDIPALKPFGVASLKKLKETQKQLNELIESIQPDVIISNTVRTHLIVSPLAKKMNIPLLWMGHDRTFPKALLKWYLRYPQAIVSCSRFVGDYYLPQSKNSVQKEILYPYGVRKSDLERIALINKQPVIGMIGKFIPWKGQDLFIQMGARIHEEFPEVRFVIIGNVYKGNHDSQAYYQKCVDIIFEKKLSHVFQIHKSDDVLSEIASWEILVHCSREPEPLGRVILEGMTAGCAVVASNLGGPNEIVHHDENGLLCPPSVSQLVHTVTNLITHDERRHHLQSTAKQWIREHFMWKNTKERFSTVLKKIMH